MFSEAISSISSRCRPRSCRITSAISGSTSRKDAENKASTSLVGLALDMVLDLAGITFSWRRERGSEQKCRQLPGLSAEIAYGPPTAKHWHVDGSKSQYLGFGRQKQNH